MTQATMKLPGEPYVIAIDDETIADVRLRLQRARLPAVETGEGWAKGTTLDYAGRLLEHWRDRFDWREQEKRFNRYTQRMVDVDGQGIHVLVEQGSGPAPLPLLLANGWPSSFVEFDYVIDKLAHPERHGGRVEDAFTVVVAGIPGYGFSPPPPGPMLPADVAAIFGKLMSREFGFEQWVAVGSDWGSLIVGTLAFDGQEGLSAVLLTTSGGLVNPATLTEPLSEEEAKWLATAFIPGPESAYQAIQGGKPQTLAFAQTDSPIGLGAWIVEKFHGWTVPGTESDPPYAMDDLVANIMVYWLNGCAAPMWLYCFLGSHAFLPAGAYAKVPAGFMFYPNDLTPPAPRAFLERIYDVRHYQLMERGGHFPAQEVPELYIDQIRTFFRAFR